MFKLIFFLLSAFIIYKVIQFAGRVFSIYSRVKNQQYQGGERTQQKTQQKKEGETTIHYKENNKDKKQSTSREKPSDEEYIDYKEVKE